MTRRKDLTPRQWQLISDAPNWVYIMLRTAEGDGLFSRGIVEKIKESNAFDEFIEGFSTPNGLIQDVVAAVIAEEHSEVSLDEPKAIAALREIAGILATVDDADSDAFKRFLLDLAQAIAEASGEGFLGSGEKVSDSEIVAVSRIINALCARSLDHPFGEWLKQT